MNRFGQAGGFVKLREAFDVIMGFHKPDLMSSMNSEEKVSAEIMGSDIEENKVNSVDSIDSVAKIAENSEVCIVF